MQRADQSPATLSAVSSLKEIVSVVMALTVTNALVLLVTGGDYSDVRELNELALDPAIFSVLLILNAIRFYHGNVRHLDSEYGIEDRHDPVKSPPGGGLGIDFFVILTQSLLFAALSFYATNPGQFIDLFLGLLVFDILWTVAMLTRSEDPLDFSTQKQWMLNNIGAGALLGGLDLFGPGDHSDPFIYGGAAIILINALRDYKISWHFYFPQSPAIARRREGRLKVVVAAPLTQELDPETGVIRGAYRKWLEQLLDRIGDAGHEVANAHVREKWGEDLASPGVAVEADLAQLSDTDVLVAYVGSPASPGVQFELGVAACRSTPVILLVDQDRSLPYLTPGLGQVTPTRVIEFRDREDAISRVVAALSSVRSAV